MLDDYIDNLKEEIVNETCNLINIPSVYEKSLDTKMPFGKPANDALLYALELGKKLGFRTKNIDGFCGYIEFGEGEKLVRNNWSFRCCASRRWLGNRSIRS